MQPLADLTKREREVLLTYAEVGQAKLVAEKLLISKKTVDTHTCNAVKKTRLNLAQLVATIATEVNKEVFEVFPTIYATNRELEVIPFICQGFSNIEIATILGITQRTVDTFVYWLMVKLGAISRYQLIACYKACPEKFRSSQSLRKSQTKEYKISKLVESGYSNLEIYKVLGGNRNYISRVKSKFS